LIFPFFLDNGPTIPHSLSRLNTGETSASWMLTIFAVMSIILVNAYKGIVTTELTANSGYIQKYTRVNQTSGFLFVVSDEGFSTDFIKLHELRNFKSITSEYKYTDVNNHKICDCFPTDVHEIIPRLCNSYLCTLASYIRDRSGMCSASHTCQNVTNTFQSFNVPKPYYPTPNSRKERVVRWFEHQSLCIGNLRS